MLCLQYVTFSILHVPTQHRDQGGCQGMAQWYGSSTGNLFNGPLISWKIQVGENIITSQIYGNPLVKRAGFHWIGNSRYFSLAQLGSSSISSVLHMRSEKRLVVWVICADRIHLAVESIFWSFCALVPLVLWFVWSSCFLTLWFFGLLGPPVMSCRRSCCSCCSRRWCCCRCNEVVPLTPNCNPPPALGYF